MTGTGRQSGGFWVFLPYVLTVLGAALGVLYVNFGTDTGNPLIGLVVGLLLGRLLAGVVIRLAVRFGAGV